MLNLRHAFCVVLPAAMLASVTGLAWADNGGTQGADQASALWKEGKAFWESREFVQARKTFLSAGKILEKEPNALPAADKNQLELYLNQVDEAIKKQSRARETYRSAVTAMGEGKFQEAKSLFGAVLEGKDYITEPEQADAKAKLALTVAKMNAQAAAQPEPEPKVAPEPEPEPEPKVAPKPEPEPEPKVEPTVADEADPESRRMLAAIARKRAAALDLVSEARRALRSNQKGRASALLNQALALVPDHAEALSLKRSLWKAPEAPRPSETILDRLGKARRLGRQMARIEFEKALNRSHEILAGADENEEFNSAERFAEVARSVAQKNQANFQPQAYRDLIRQVDDQLKFIRLKRTQWQRITVAKQIRIINAAERERIRRERLQKLRTINTLALRAKTLRSQGKFKSALEICEQIVELDPNNRSALEQAEILRQFVQLQNEKRLDELQRDEEQKVLIDVRESEIPWYELLRYPRDWRELTIRRVPFGAAAATVSETDRAVRHKLGLRVPKLDFNEVRFENVIDFLREISGLSIHVKWNVLNAARIYKTAPVTVHLTNVTIKKSLRVILDEVGGVKPLGYVLDDGVIMISTKEDLSRITITRVYDIRDLVVRVPKFRAPRVALADSSSNNAAGKSPAWPESANTSSAA